MSAGQIVGLGTADLMDIHPNTLKIMDTEVHY